MEFFKISVKRAHVSLLRIAAGRMQCQDHKRLSVYAAVEYTSSTEAGCRFSRSVEDNAFIESTEIVHLGSFAKICYPLRGQLTDLVQSHSRDLLPDEVAGHSPRGYRGFHSHAAFSRLAQAEIELKLS